jgi:hypothetical protein
MDDDGEAIMTTNCRIDKFFCASCSNYKQQQQQREQQKRAVAAVEWKQKNYELVSRF